MQESSVRAFWVAKRQDAKDKRAAAWAEQESKSQIEQDAVTCVLIRRAVEDFLSDVGRDSYVPYRDRPRERRDYAVPGRRE
jgi:hypothetical protein